MQISDEGKIGIALTLIGLGGGGAVILAPTYKPLGWALITVCVVGLVILAAHHCLAGRIRGLRWKLSLQEASRRLYEAMQGTEWCAVADRHSKTEDERLNAGGYSILHIVDAFARRPPSRKLELFKRESLVGGHILLVGGAKEFRRDKDGAVVFSDLSVRRRDLRKAIRILKVREAR